MLLLKTETKLIHLNNLFPFATKRHSVDATNIQSEVSDLCTNKTKTNSK
jgi:hypothetical protein